jgi:FkbM family methyltransferase
MHARHVFLVSYSQSDEDLIIDTLLNRKPNGFYIDIGAYDPVRFSNTMRFYRRGWSGINIEPDYTQFQKIKSVRTRDITLNIGISPKNKTLVYWEINPNTLSTFLSVQAKAYEKEGFRIIRQIRVPVSRLFKVIKKYAHSKPIDFLSVDVEGFELDVLKSNNWGKYRPKVLCIELSFCSSDTQADIRRKKSLIRFIESKGYIYVTKTATNYIYVDRKLHI